MRVNRFTAHVALLCLAVGLVAGCANTKGYVIAVESYNTALSGLIEARKAGKLSDAQYRQAEAARVIAALALDKTKDATASGNTVNAAAALRAFADAVGEMRKAGPTNGN